MNTHQFVFPPPPPPPPPIQVTSNQGNHAGSSSGHKYDHSNRGNRGDRGSRGSRGRGQSASKRGSRGGNFGALSVPAQAGYAQQNNSPFLPQDVHTHTNKPGNNYPLPEYPSVQQPQYPANVSNYGPLAATFPAASIASPSPHPEYYNTAQGQLQFQNGQPQTTPYNYNSRNQNTLHYPHGPQQYSSTQARPEHSNNPQLMMGPPLRMGFNNGYPGTSQQIQSPSQIQQQSLPSRTNSLQQGTRPFMRPSFQTNPLSISSAARHHSPNAFADHRNHGQRRHHTAFGGQRRFNTKTQVAPAVPSFGNPLPVKPPAPQEIARRAKKKKRRHNQLGLTPKTLEHESSEEEENDVDEEANLAVAAGLPDSARQQ